MKKHVLILIVTILTFPIFAQKVELAGTYSFGNIPFEFDTEWEPNEGFMPHFEVKFISKENEFFLWSYHNKAWYQLLLDGTSKLIYSGINDMDTDPFYFSDRNGYMIGYQNHAYDVWKMKALVTSNGKVIDIDIPLKGAGNLYRTGDIVFLGMNTIEFLPDGSYKIRNASETESWLKSGKGEELGWSQKFNKRTGKVSGTYFGDVDLSKVDRYYNPSCFDNVHDDEIIGAAFDALRDSRYNNFAKDSKGLIYYRKMDTDNGPFDWGEPSPNIKFDIAILDPWTKQVKYYEDYAPNEWNPPRDANGIIIGSYSWTVAPDGNIYFTDADVEKGEYQIKRVINRWWDDMGINDRIIGQMNTNHIPLLTTMNGSQNDGYCFENGFVWVIEQSKDKKWSKIKKIDGREGWIETKYIDINTMVPVTNASLGIKIEQSSASTPAPTTPTAKILKAADNLRLRKTELTSSEVITTMLKGTPVKIVATGRKETIDGITGNWVQVEVQPGGKDRNGSSIPAGTTGWCFGGYLE